MLNCGRYAITKLTIKASTDNPPQDTEKLPDWGKVQWVVYEPQSWTSILPHTSDEARDLVGGLVKYQSTERLEAASV